MDKAKIISDLYKEKSYLLKNLSELADPSYIFVLGKRYKSIYFGSDTLAYDNIDVDFIRQIKEKLIAHYKNKIGDIDVKLEEMLKNVSI